MSGRSKQEISPGNPGDALKNIVDALYDLQFGSVEITVHEGRIVLIERKEKQRLNIPLRNH